jgi:hypothetical protein
MGVVTTALATIAVGCVTVTEPDVAVQVGVATCLAVTVYGDPAEFTVKVLPAWKAPPFKLYSTAPAAPPGVAVNVVVPLLHNIVPAEADTVRAQAAAGNTSTVEVEPLSAVKSPGVAVPDAEPGATPGENHRLPETVEGPPSAFPCIAINIVRVVFGGTWSVPFESLITEPELKVIVQPEGNTWPVAGILTSAEGTLIWGLNL